MNRSDPSARVRMFRWASWLFGAALLVGLMLAVARFGEIQEFTRLAHQAEPRWLALAFMLQITTYLSAAAVWQGTLRRSGVSLGIGTLARLSVAKLFMDQAFPSGGVSGSALVLNFLIARNVPRGVSLAALLVGFLGFYIAYGILVAASLSLLAWHHAVSPLILGTTGIFLGVAAAIPAGIFWLHRTARHPTAAWIHRFGFVDSLLKTMAEAPSDVLHSPALIARASFFQLLVFLADTATLWAMLRAVGQASGPDVALIAFILGSVAATIGPIPLGLGTFEVTAVALLTLLGIPVEASLTATLLLRGFTFWLPMIPGLWLVRRQLGTSAQRPEGPKSGHAR